MDSAVPEPERQEFEALGHAGSEHYSGLEVFDNPGCHTVTYVSDEVVAHCPVTGQPDFYTCEILLRTTEKCIESKSLKLWLQQFNTKQNGIFCESLAIFVRDQVGFALGYRTKYSEGPDAPTEEVPDLDTISEHVQVTLYQKSRGGISIRSVA